MIPFSVGICAHNEEKNIGNVLNLLHNTKLGGFRIKEILVVASGCTDGTCDIVKEWQKRDRRIKLIVERKRRGKVVAFNKILHMARGKIFVSADADQYFGKNTLQSILNHFHDSKVGAISSNVEYLKSNKLVGKSRRVVHDLYVESLKRTKIKNKLSLFSVLNAFRKNVCNNIPKNIVNETIYTVFQCKMKGMKALVDYKSKTYIKAPDTLSESIEERRRIIYEGLMMKRITGFAPSKPVIALKDKIRIILKFILRDEWQTIFYFLFGYCIESCANLLARLDTMKKENPHTLWKMIRTTKRLDIDFDKITR